MRSTSSSFLRRLARAGLLLALPLAASGCLSVAVAMMIHEASAANVCEQAMDHLAECVGADAVPSEDSEIECTEVIECASECINSVDCTALQDIFNGMVTSRSQVYVDCVTACSSG